MKHSPLDKILGQLDQLDTTNLTILVQRLARERLLLETVFNIMKEGMIILSQGGGIHYANRAAMQLLGFKDKDLGKIELWQFLPDFKRMFIQEFYPQDKLPPTLTREIQIHYPEKRYLRVHIVAFEVEDKFNKLERRFALIFTDLTEERLSHEAYVENAKIDSIFTLAAGVAHELGNPLNSMHIHLQLMQRLIEGSPSVSLEAIEKNRSTLKDALNVCLAEVKRLDGIIKHFLEAIRPAFPDKQPLELKSLIQEVLQFIAQELEDLHIQVELFLDQTLPPLWGDRGQVKQVLFNLLRNASEAMDSGGVIKISAKADDAFLYIYIADNGCGIPSHDMPKVFEPYASTKSTGNGLGMMIVQRILRDHGGFIGINSEEGVGTLVTLQFPLLEKRAKLLTTGGQES